MKYFVVALHIFVLFQLISYSEGRRKFSSTKKYTSSRNPVAPFYSPQFLFKRSRRCSETNDNGAPFRYHRETKRCYMVGERGPCGELMEFILVDEDYGTCDCSQKLRCGRPLIFWPETKSCYYVNEQGPCAPGKWLVFGLYDHPVCKRNPCLSKIAKTTSRGNYFWFEFKGKCYRTGSQGYCSESSQVLFIPWRGYKPKCMSQDTLKCPNVNPIPKTECLPGMKSDSSEHCSKLKQQIRKASGIGFGNYNQPIPNVYHLTLE